MGASSKLLKTLPSFEEMSAIMTDLRSQGEKAAVLLGASYLDQCLEKLLVASFRPLSKKEHNGFFEGNGILASYSAKVQLCWAMSLIEPETRDALALIGQIRNVFAHTLHTITFENELIAEDCKKLAVTPFLVIKMSLDDPESYRDILTTKGNAFDIYAKACEALYTGLLGAILVQLGSTDHTGGSVQWLKGVDLGLD